MNVVLRGVRVIDPVAGRDEADLDLWLRDGRLVAVDHRISASGARIVDLTPPRGGAALVVCPGFIDLHTHLREPGDEAKETVRSGAAAAAAGGFTQVVAMANTTPAVDTPDRVGEMHERAARVPVRVLPAAAVTRGLLGAELVDIAGCTAAGAAAFSDDGRNAAPARLLAEALAAAAACERPILVHPEDEAMVLASNPPGASVTRCEVRPSACEEAAVDAALRALANAGRGRLHLQHLSCAGAVQRLRAARELGVTVTAEATPHHLSMWLPPAAEARPRSLRKVNPPLRSEADRTALVQALRDGVIDAVATDHAPHAVADKDGDYAEAAPGMIGLETAFGLCNSVGAMGGAWLPVLLERLTAGPWRVLGAASGLLEPRLRTGSNADLVLLDPEAAWTVGADRLRSRSRNTPLLGAELRGRVLLTLAGGTVAHLDGDEVLAGAFTEPVASA
ncbi:MAG TPA: dihydroorotase [Candidatus Dormibacteraeota bacterium]